MKRIKILYTLVCDDVRREDNGKEILIGVYSTNIVVAHFPVTMRLVFWMQVSILLIEQISFDFRVIGPHDVQIVSAHVEFEMERQGTGQGTIPLPIPIQIQSAGDLRLELREGPEDEWEEVKRITVTQAAAKAH